MNSKYKTSRKDSTYVTKPSTKSTMNMRDKDGIVRFFKVSIPTNNRHGKSSDATEVSLTPSLQTDLRLKRSPKRSMSSKR